MRTAADMKLDLKLDMKLALYFVVLPSQAGQNDNQRGVPPLLNERQALYERRLHDIQEAALARIEAARRNRKQGRMTRAALFTQVHTVVVHVVPFLFSLQSNPGES